MKKTAGKVNVEVGWEDDEIAQVISITCKCGHQEHMGDDFTMSHNEVWTCPKCGAKIMAIYDGMTFKEI